MDKLRKQSCNILSWKVFHWRFIIKSIFPYMNRLSHALMDTVQSTFLANKRYAECIENKGKVFSKYDKLMCTSPAFGSHTSTTLSSYSTKRLSYAVTTDCESLASLQVSSCCSFKWKMIQKKFNFRFEKRKHLEEYEVFYFNLSLKF